MYFDMKRAKKITDSTTAQKLSLGSISQQISQLTKDVDRRFERVYTKLSDHDIRLARIEATMVTKTEFNQLYNLVDFIAKEIKDYQQERYAMHDRLDRLDGRVTILEAKVL
jgi:hypothetical protein